VDDSGNSETIEKNKKKKKKKKKRPALQPEINFSGRNVLHDLSFLVVTSLELQLHPSLNVDEAGKEDETGEQNNNLAKDVPTLILFFFCS